MKGQTSVRFALSLFFATGALAQSAISDARTLAHLDLGLLGENPGGSGSGSGIKIDTGSPGKNAGLHSAGGLSLGAEVRLAKLVWLDGSVGYYRPNLEVVNFVDFETRISSETYAVSLIPLTIGVNFRPASWSSRTAALAVGAQAVRLAVSGVPEEAGISLENGSWGLGVRGRGDVAFGKGWLASLDLQFTSSGANPDFTDIATGSARELQCSGMFLKLGVGRRF
jgi:hypothetical protein